MVQKAAYWPVSSLAFSTMKLHLSGTRPLLTASLSSVLVLNQQTSSCPASQLSAKIPHVVDHGGDMLGFLPGKSQTDAVYTVGWWERRHRNTIQDHAAGLDPSQSFRRRYFSFLGNNSSWPPEGRVIKVWAQFFRAPASSSVCLKLSLE